MENRAKFTHFDQCTKEDIQCVMDSYTESSKRLPQRILDHLRLLDGDFGGFNVDRLEHSLQTATRAHRDGKDEEYVVVALLHDIGDTLNPYDHGAFVAAMLKPFISEANHWLLENHPVFQGYYYFDFIGKNKDAREALKDSPHYEHTLEFIEKYDMPSFDHNYDSMSIEEFEPMVERVLSQEVAFKRRGGRIPADVGAP